MELFGIDASILIGAMAIIAASLWFIVSNGGDKSVDESAVSSSKKLKDAKKKSGGGKESGSGSNSTQVKNASMGSDASKVSQSGSQKSIDQIVEDIIGNENASQGKKNKKKNKNKGQNGNSNGGNKAVNNQTAYSMSNWNDDDDDDDDDDNDDNSVEEEPKGKIPNKNDFGKKTGAVKGGDTSMHKNKGKEKYAMDKLDPPKAKPTPKKEVKSTTTDKIDRAVAIGDKVEDSQALDEELSRNIAEIESKYGSMDQKDSVSTHQIMDDGWNVVETNKTKIAKKKKASDTPVIAAPTTASAGNTKSHANSNSNSNGNKEHTQKKKEKNRQDGAMTTTASHTNTSSSNVPMASNVTNNVPASGSNIGDNFNNFNMGGSTDLMSFDLTNPDLLALDDEALGVSTYDAFVTDGNVIPGNAFRLEGNEGAVAGQNVILNEKIEIKRTMSVENRRMGVIIGAKGATKLRLQELTSCEIQTPRNTKREENEETGEISTVKIIRQPTELVDVTIVGYTDSDVNTCVRAIQDLIEKGYASILEGPEFSEGHMIVPSNRVGEIIGSQGSILKTIEKEFEVRLNVPKDVPKGIHGNVVPTKVGINGHKAKVKAAKECIKSIIQYRHHDSTHPGVVHSEMAIDEQYYKSIIGTGGSEIKQIQNNFKVNVIIPDSTTATIMKELEMPQDLLVVGAQEQVTRACDYIQKIVDRVSAPREEKDDEYDEDIIVTDDEEVGEWEAQYKAPSAAINLADFPGFS